MTQARIIRLQSDLFAVFAGTNPEISEWNPAHLLTKEELVSWIVANIAPMIAYDSIDSVTKLKIAEGTRVAV